MNFDSLFARIAEPGFRVRLHYSLTLIAGAVALALPPGIFVDISTMAEDKAAHFEAGRLIVTGSFVLLYFALSTFILLFLKSPITLRLLYLPTGFALAGGLAMGVVFLVAGGKEALDSTGVGTVDWHDFTATLDGAFLPNIDALLFLLGLTPVLIPLDMLLQWPAKARSDKGTGHQDVDTYLSARKIISSRKAEVLIVEDDLSCANLALKFCKKIGKACIHEDTIAGAARAFGELEGQLQLILLDLFVRVESDGDRRTGAEWLEEISRHHPKGHRSFLVVITTGHPEQLGAKADLADKVLPKPWSPADLLAFLKEHAIIDP